MRIKYLNKLYLSFLLGISSLVVHTAIAQSQSIPSAACSKLAAKLLELEKDKNIIPGSYIIKFKNNFAERAHSYLGLNPSAGRLQTEGKALVHLFSGNTITPSQRYLAQTNVHLFSNVRDFRASMLGSKFSNELCDQIEYIEPDIKISIKQQITSDLNLYLWGLDNYGQDGGIPDVDIDAPEAWQASSAAEQVVVGIIDSGVDYTHPDLKNSMWVNPGEIANNGVDDDNNGYTDDIHGINQACALGFFGSCFEYEGARNDPMDLNGHGTHVAGTIAAVANGRGSIGAAPNAKVMALKFLSSSGSGATSDALAMMNYAISMKSKGVNIRVLNNSWGSESTCATSMSDSIAAVNNAGIVFMAAAGNESLNLDLNGNSASPAECPGAISVASVDRYGALSSFSNYGATAVDIAAPGELIFSTYIKNKRPNHLYVFLNGTSMAAPHASAVAAVLLGMQPQLSPADVLSKLKSKIKPLGSLSGKLVSPGIISAKKVLE